jgi:hypothetical protein
MNIIRKAISTFAGISLAVLLFAALAPKATRGVAAALVQVTNTASNAVPTEDGPGNFPFGASLCAEFEHAECEPGTPAIFAVPLTTSTGLAVKRLVIEDTGMSCDVDTGASSILGVISAPFPLDSVQSGLAMLRYELSTTLIGTTTAIAHSPVRIYLDPGATLITAAGGDFPKGTGTTCFFSLTGHLETK